jgi:hypothetical protein
MCSDLISKSPCSLTCGSVLTTCIFPLLQLQYIQWAFSRGCKEDGKKGLQVWRLQAALGEQAEITKQQQQEFDRLQNVNI